jgi:predicted Rossmann fold flavoprotein
MAAMTASSRGEEVVLIDRNPDPGRKLLLTGGGRCNITNLCEVEEFIGKIPYNGEFLYTALYSLDPASLVDEFEKWGLQTVQEEGGRIFPSTGRSSDVLRMLVEGSKKNGVRFMEGRAVSIDAEHGSVRSVRVENGTTIDVGSVILATGGITYPETGSTGDGYAFARRLGHTINRPESRIRPWIVESGVITGLQGLTLEDASIKVVKESYRGSLLFTHGGITGPVVFDADIREGGSFPLEISIDLLPQITGEAIEGFIQRAREMEPRKKVANILSGLIPRRLAERVVSISGIIPDTNINQLGREMRGNLISSLKDLNLRVTGAENRAGMITSGGVDTGQVDPSTMESRLVKGLFFAGEILDVHAGTGGFNLQIAFSTGYLAGENC